MINIIFFQIDDYLYGIIEGRGQSMWTMIANEAVENPRHKNLSNPN